MNKNDLGREYARMGLAYDKEVKQGQMAVYYEFLQSYSVEALRYAIKHAIPSIKWFPKVSELVEIMSGYKPIIQADRQLKEAEPVPPTEEFKNILNNLKGVSDEV